MSRSDRWIPFFWKYLFPCLYGLLFYTVLRLVSDLTNADKFWERRWQQNVIEVVSVVLLSFGTVRLPRYFLNKFKKKKRPNNARTAFPEFGEILLCAMILATSVSSIVHVLSHDYPIGIDDLVIVNVLLALFLLLHYAIVRGNDFVQAYVEQKLLVEKVRNDQLQTELKFLKAQYHPHFLFNALNTVYFQMDEDVAGAKKSVEKFSELLRYQLYDQQQTVAVGQEIHYLTNFIQLQQTRTSEKLQLTVSFDEKLDGQQVYPLLFLPLVENAFKYVGGDYLLLVDVRVEGMNIRLRVENSIPAGIQGRDIPAGMPARDEGGIGLENLKRRLELLYPGRHSISAEKKDSTFVASLIIEYN